MILIIRFIGLINAAIWLGAAVFLTFGAAPAFFSSDVKALGLHPFWPGSMAQVVLSRFFYLQYICGAVALAHLLAEWVYLGRRLHRFTLGLLLALICVGFAGGLWIEPKIKRLHLVMYSMSDQYKPAAIPAAERVEARKSFGMWHGVSRVMNLFSLAGLVVYFWRVAHPSDHLRFVSATKFRS